MKRAKLIMVALCTIFAAMLVVGCQNAASGNSGSGGGSGTTTSALAPFAGTTWKLTTDASKTFVFNANGTVTGGMLTEVSGVSYSYTVQNSNTAVISMVSGGTPIGTFGKLVIASADATTGARLYMFMAGSFQTSPEPGEYNKQ
jgi:CDP-diglyceride synthetase